APQTLAKALAKEHLSSGQLQQYLMQQIELEDVYHHQTRHVKSISAAQAQTYYQQHLAEFTTPKEALVHEIVVKNKKTAQHVEDQVKHGASYDALAKKYGQVPAESKLGNTLVWVKEPSTGTNAALSAQVQKMKAGQMVMMPSHHEYIVVTLETVKAGQTLAFSQVQRQLQTELTNKKKMGQFNHWVNDLVKTGHVKYFR
ncbi:MAG: peptidyl-prolyl cis-trans isomerase, partial [Firmicutes bacterium]|nr:peptidyl-prolyl cis-trans isomerase [Bacillota bacterium]